MKVPYRHAALQIPAPPAPPAPDTTIPAAPSNLVAEVLPDGSVQISGTAGTDNVGVDGYLVYLNGSVVPVKKPALPITLKGLDVGSHYARLRTIDKAGNLSAESALITFTIAASNYPAGWFNKPRKRRGVVLHADSITGNDGNPQFFNTELCPLNPPNGGPGNITAMSWFRIAQAMLGNPWEVLANFAIGGSTLTRAYDGLPAHEYFPMEDRIDYVLSVGADRVIVGPWAINDMKSTGQRGFRDCLFEAEKQLNRLLSAGVKVTKISILPMGSGASGVSVSELDEIAPRFHQMFRYEKDLFVGVEGVDYIDAFTPAFTDLTARYMQCDTGLHYDGLHPGGRYAYLIARLIYNFYKDKLPRRDHRAVCKNDSFFGTRKTVSSVVISNGVGVATTVAAHKRYVGDYIVFSGNSSPTELTGPYRIKSVTTTTFTFDCPAVPNGSAAGTTYCSANLQYFENPLFFTGTDIVDPANTQVVAGNSQGAGTVSGTIPNGVTINAPANTTIVCSLIPRTDRPGNNLRMVITTTAAVTGIAALARATQYVLPVVGKYRYAVGLQIQAATVDFELNPYLNISDGAGFNVNVNSLQNTVNTKWSYLDAPWNVEQLWETPDLVTNDSGRRATGQAWAVRIDLSAAGSVTLDIGIPTIFPVIEQE